MRSWPQGGVFTPGKDSIVVPIQSLTVSQEHVSFFVPIAKETMMRVPCPIRITNGCRTKSGAPTLTLSFDAK
jgi:hypothetical protein